MLKFQDVYCLFDLILYIPSTIFQLYRDRSSWVEPVLSQDKCVLLKDHNQGCILAGISFLSISSILLPTRKSGIRRDKYLSAAIFKEAVHSDDS